MPVRSMITEQRAVTGSQHRSIGQDDLQAATGPKMIKERPIARTLIHGVADQAAERRLMRRHPLVGQRIVEAAPALRLRKKRTPNKRTN